MDNVTLQEPENRVHKIFLEEESKPKLKLKRLDDDDEDEEMERRLRQKSLSRAKERGGHCQPPQRKITKMLPSHQAQRSEAQEGKEEGRSDKHSKSEVGEKTNISAKDDKLKDINSLASSCEGTLRDGNRENSRESEKKATLLGPPHETKSQDSNTEENCQSEKKATLLGPALPPHNTQSQDTTTEESKQTEKRAHNIQSQDTTTEESKQPEKKARVLGPTLPPHLAQLKTKPEVK